MKEVTEKTTKGYTIPIVNILKGVMTGFIITVILFVFYALLLTYTTITEKNMSVIVTACMIMSVIISGITSGRGINEKGWLWGMVTGLVYAVLAIIIGVLTVEEGIEIGTSAVSMLFMCVAAGGLGGMIGINIVKKG